MEGDPLHHRTASGPGTSQGVGFRSGRCVCVCVCGGGVWNTKSPKEVLHISVHILNDCMCVCVCVHACV